MKMKIEEKKMMEGKGEEWKTKKQSKRKMRMEEKAKEEK